ncbi:MAG: CsiV family protein [Lysobacterales bacterium]
MRLTTRSNPPNVLAVLLGLFVGIPAATGQTSTTDTSEVRYYVEILVFQRENAQESLYRFPGEPDSQASLDLWPVNVSPFGRPRPNQPTNGVPLRPVTDLFVAMADDVLVMTREWQALSAEPALTPLAHRGWHQPAATFGDPQPVRVNSAVVVDTILKDTPTVFIGNQISEQVFSVDGTVALERGRFLHLRLDVAMHLKGRRGAPHYGDIATLEQPGSYTTHRITERRQVSLDAVNYFDHRFFGVVALVKQWPLEGAEQQEN